MRRTQIRYYYQVLELAVSKHSKNNQLMSIYKYQVIIRKLNEYQTQRFLFSTSFRNLALKNSGMYINTE